MNVYIIIVLCAISAVKTLECPGNLTANQSYVEVSDMVMFTYSGPGSCYHWTCNNENYDCLRNCTSWYETGCCVDVFVNESNCIQMLIKYNFTKQWNCITNMTEGKQCTVNIFEYKRSSVEFANFNGTIIENTETEIKCRAGHGDPPTSRIDIVVDGKNDSCVVNSSNNLCTARFIVNRTLTNHNLTCYGYQLDYKYQSTIQVPLDVLYPPDKASIESKDEAIVRENVILTCELEDLGNPSVLTYDWTITTSSSNSPDCSPLNESKINCTITSACSVNFTCNVINSVGQTSSSKVLAINERLTITSPISNSIHNVCYHSTGFEIICSAYGKPRPATSWFIDEFVGILSQNHSQGVYENCSEFFNQQLFWGNRDVEERKHIINATIVCEASHMESSSNVSVILNTEFPPGQPNISTVSPIVEVKNDAQFYCNLTESGNPPATEFVFHNGDIPICVNSTNQNCILSINNINQEGSYVCQAKNKPNSSCSDISIQSTPIELTVFVPAEFKLVQENVNAIYGDESFNLTCEAIGKPNPNVTLYKDGIVTDKFKTMPFTYCNETKYGLQEVHGANFTWGYLDPNSTCETIVAYDSDNYSCVIENAAADGSTHPSQSQVFQLKTMYQPLWNDSERSQVLAEMYQDTLIITCHMCAYPVLQSGNFTWLNDSQEIIPNENDNSLVIRNITESSFTNVTCIANNGIGNTTKQVIHIVESGPPRIESLRVLGTTSISITVEWISGNGSNPPVYTDVYSRMYNDLNSTYELYSSGMRNGSIINETITNLTSTTNYEIRVYSENLYHKTNYTEESTSSRTRDSPNVNFTRSTLKDGLVTATWTYDDIDKMKIMNKMNDESIEYRVEVRVIYWDPSHTGIFWNPGLDEDPIPAYLHKHSFNDPAVNPNFWVSIEVYENGILNHNLKMAKAEIDDIGINVGAIVGSVVFVAVLSALAVLSFVYRERIKNQFNRRHDDEIEIHSQQGIPHDDQNTASAENLTAVAPVYAEVVKKKSKFVSSSASQERNATDKPTSASEGFTNPLYAEFRNPVPLKPKPRREDLPGTRYMDENGCIFIKNEAIYFPNARSSPDGKPSPIICVEDRVEYSTIDFSIPPETPPPDSEEEKENEEDDVMGTLPDRRTGDGEDGGEDDDEDLW